MKCLLRQIEVSTIVSQAGATLSGLVSRTQDLVCKLKALHFDRHEFVCLKYLVLFNPGELPIICGDPAASVSDHLYLIVCVVCSSSHSLTFILTQL